MKRNLFTRVELLAIGQKTLIRAQRRFLSCQRCDPKASTPLALIIDGVLGPSAGDATEYLLSEPAKCPSCAQGVYETTLVRPDSAFTLPQNLNCSYEPPLDETRFTFVDDATLQRAQVRICGCEHCCPEAEVSLDLILDELTGCDPTTTEYLLSRATSCPLCFSEITEKTLVITAW